MYVTVFVAVFPALSVQVTLKVFWIGGPPSGMTVSMSAPSATVPNVLSGAVSMSAGPSASWQLHDAGMFEPRLTVPPSIGVSITTVGGLPSTV